MGQGSSFIDRTNALRVATTRNRVSTKNTVFPNHDRARTSARIHVPFNVTKQAVFNHHVITAEINRRIAPPHCVIHKRVSFTAEENLAWQLPFDDGIPGATVLELTMKKSVRGWIVKAAITH
jgi:hypothetical protein